MKKLFTKHTDKELKEKFLQIKSFAELADILEVKTGHLYYWLNIQQDKDRYLKFKILKKMVIRVLYMHLKDHLKYYKKN